MSSSEYVENPVLFLYGKVDVINQDDLTNICASFYSDEERTKEKLILYQLLQREGDLIQRRADTRKKIIVRHATSANNRNYRRCEVLCY